VFLSPFKTCFGKNVHTFCEASCHPHASRLQIAQHVLAHGEQHRLRSVVALPDQVIGPRSYIVPRRYIANHRSLP